MNKMTLQDLKGLFAPPSAHETTNRDGLTVRTRATMKNHRHAHNPTWKPTKSKLTPAKWKRARRAAAQKAAS